MHKLKLLSETPPKPDFWLSSAVHSLITSTWDADILGIMDLGKLGISGNYLMCLSSCTLTSLIITLFQPVLLCLTVLSLPTWSLATLLDSLYSDWILFLSRYYMFQLSLCSHLGSPINGSVGSPNHSVLDFKDPFDYSIQWLSDTQHTPSKNRSLVVLIDESSLV